MAYTSTDLLNIIKKRAFLPISQETFTDASLLEMATDELYSQVVPEVLATREEWYVTDFPVVLDGSESTVDIPSRAIGGALREVSFTQGEMEFSLSRLSLEDKQYTNSNVGGALSAFYVQGNQLHLFGSQAGTINLYFNCRPGRLVLTEEAAVITALPAVDPDTGLVINPNILTLSAVPAVWNTGTVVDIVKAKPHFEYRNLSLTIVNIIGNMVEFDLAPSTTISVGDFVTLEDTSPAPQIPLEWFQYLAECVVMQVFLSQGDKEAADAAEKKCEKLKKSAVSLMSPRVQGEAKRTVPPKNRGSYLNSRWR